MEYKQLVKDIIFVGGLPRSGSTLLTNLMAQHPEVYCYGQSGLPAMIQRVVGGWYEIPQHRQNKAISEMMLKETLRGMVVAYHAAYGAGCVVCDHSRGWPKQIERMEWILDKPVKLVVPVRRIASILASFEKLYRKNVHQVLPQEKAKYSRMADTVGRCLVWLDDDEPLGMSIRLVRDAIVRGHAKKMLFVDYDELCTHPAASMARVWAFLEMEQVKHDFDNVEQETVDADNDLLAHGIDNLHKIGRKVRPPADDAEEVLGREAFRRFGNLSWKP
jgi:sulfotransferase